MSYNLVDPTTGDLTLVAGRNAIDDGSVSNSKVWSSRKVSDELEKKVDKDLTNATGTLPVANGGTGATTAKNGFVSLANGLTQGQDPQDEEYMIYKSSGHWGLYTLFQFWEYIKGKISSVLGLTASDYNGRARIATNADYSKNMYLQTFDLTSLDKTKFYPLVCSHSYYFEEVAIFSEGGPGDIEFNQNRIHFDISTTGWSDTPFTLNIKEYACHDSNEINIGCIGRGEHFGVWALWLRGGLRYICQSRNSDLSLKTSDYTIFDEVFTVGTNYYGGANSNVSIVFTPQSTITEGAYSTRPITAPNITSLEQRVTALESKLLKGE